MADPSHPDRSWWAGRSTEIGPCPEDASITVTLVLHRKAKHRYAALVGDVVSATTFVEPMAPRHLFGRFGAPGTAVQRVKAWAVREGLEVIEDASTDQTLSFRAPASTIHRVFATQLFEWETPVGTLRAPRLGSPPVPNDLLGDVAGVLGVDKLGELSLPPRPIRGTAVDLKWTAADYRTLYSVPADLTGQGRVIGLLAGGGGLDVSNPTLATYFKCLGTPVPKITVKPLLGTKDEPTSMGAIEAVLLAAEAGTRGTPWGCTRSIEPCQGSEGANPIDNLSQLNWTAEILMQIMVIGGMAPDAEIVIYLTPPTAAGVIAGLEAAATDRVDSLSMPWGTPEGSWIPSVVEHVERALSDAALVGVSVCCSTGNSGASLLVDDNEFGPVVQYPASSSQALAVGGTQFTKVEGGKVTETIVWNETAFGTQGATGGGFSSTEPMGAWQKTAGISRIWHTTRRCLPDVSANASFAEGCWLWYASQPECGVNSKSSGTSASVAIWATLSALLAEATGKPAGLYSPLLYRDDVMPNFIDPISGNNSLKAGAAGYSATHDWDPCTGLGSPQFDALLAVLKPYFDRAR